MTSDSSLLASDMAWLKSAIQKRIGQLLNNEKLSNGLASMAQAVAFDDAYADLVTSYHLSLEERAILVLSLAPTILPSRLDIFKVNNPNTGVIYSEFGGTTIGQSLAFIPTGETAVFLLAGQNLTSRALIYEILSSEGRLFKHNLLRLDDTPIGAPPMSGILHPTQECLHRVYTKKEYNPTYSSSFPAQRLETRLDWDDLVLAYDTYEALDELEAWLSHHNELEQLTEVTKKFKRGYRALFHGPSGTGKTLTASLLGKKYGREVYHVDLAMTVSKYIGETEKNLKNIFDTAEHKDWVLFFDEADALFGKRTQSNSSNDRHANQEVSYLLQRIEDYPGLILLASNLKSNMDKAFQRRFQSMVYFPAPAAEERYMLWKKVFESHLKLDSAINLRNIAKRHELTGGSISNILRYCSLMAIKKGIKMVTSDDLEAGIRRELMKDGKTI